MRVPLALIPALQDAFVAPSEAVLVAHSHADVALVGYAAAQSHIAGALSLAPSSVPLASKIAVCDACCHSRAAAFHRIVDFSSDIPDLFSPPDRVNVLRP